MERALNRRYKEYKASLPQQLDEYTSIIDIKIKLNQVTLIHVLSKNAIDKFQNTNNGAKVLEDYVIKNACKSKEIMDSIEVGIDLKYVYLYPNLKSEFLSFKIQRQCTSS